MSLKPCTIILPRGPHPDGHDANYEPLPQCQWLPWDAEKMDREKHWLVWRPNNLPFWVEWCPRLRQWIDTNTDDTFDIAPTHYLANIPEPPQ